MKKIFNLFKSNKTKKDKCKYDHNWVKDGTAVIDPDGWYDNQPCHEVIYVCTKCGKRKYEKV